MNPLLMVLLAGLLAILAFLGKPLGEYLGDVLEREPILSVRFRLPSNAGFTGRWGTSSAIG